MVTARVTEVDRLVGLELGADDYICKPYSPREVVARVKAVLRRTALLEVSESIRMERETLSVHYRNRSLELTLVEWRLLDTLVRGKQRIFSREQLMDRVYADQRVVNDRTIDSHINKLRKKLHPIFEGDTIRSVYGAGYKFELPDAND